MRSLTHVHVIAIVHAKNERCSDNGSGSKIHGMEPALAFNSLHREIALKSSNREPNTPANDWCYPASKFKVDQRKEWAPPALNIFWAALMLASQ